MKQLEKFFGKSEKYFAINYSREIMNYYHKADYLKLAKN